MQLRIFTTLVFLTASVFFLSENIQAKRLKQFTEMYEAKIDGFGVAEYDFGKTYCIDFTKEKRVCKAYKSDDGGLYFIVQKNQETVGTWEHPPGVGNWTSSFYVYFGDLDKDNVSELVVVSNVNTTNGRLVPTSNVYILSEPFGENFKKPLVFPVEEFGERDNFIYDVKRRETLILATEWKNYDNLDKQRGAGIYLVGRWFRYRKGLLEFATDRPILARRYLFSFEKERWKTLDDTEFNHRPYLWLKNPSTRKFHKEPKEISELLSVKFGTIEKYEEISLFENYQSERKLTVRLDSGEAVICLSEFPNQDYERQKPEWENVISISNFGVLPQRLALPFEFGFSAVFEKVEGKKVKIETYKGKYGEYSHLWFINK